MVSISVNVDMTTCPSLPSSLPTCFDEHDQGQKRTSPCKTATAVSGSFSMYWMMQ